jgi:hypothetical protein
MAVISKWRAIETELLDRLTALRRREAATRAERALMVSLRDAEVAAESERLWHSAVSFNNTERRRRIFHVLRGRHPQPLGNRMPKTTEAPKRRKRTYDERHPSLAAGTAKGRKPRRPRHTPKRELTGYMHKMLDRPSSTRWAPIPPGRQSRLTIRALEQRGYAEVRTSLVPNRDGDYERLWRVRPGTVRDRSQRPATVTAPEEA